MSVNRSSEKMLSHALLSSLFFSHDFIQIRFALFEFFCFCFMSNKYYLSKFNAKFSLSEDILLCKLNFRYWWQTYAIKFRYWSKSISWKYFMFHEMPLKLYLMKCSERKISQCILPFRISINIDQYKINMSLQLSLRSSHSGKFPK